MLPTLVKTPKTNAIAVCCQSNYSLILMNDGTVYACGRNTRGRLSASLPEKLEIPTLIPELHSIKMVSCGLWHVLALDS
jgi:alpha-tubulin suppressor-like RCC1 family protein